MITKTFKKLMAGMLQSLGSSYYTLYPFKDCSGNNRYLSLGVYNYFPRSVTYSLSLSDTSAGIVLGTGTTVPTEDDYCIEEPITSGLSATVTYQRGQDENGYPYLTFTLLLTNTGSSDIVVREIGYNQTVQGYSSQYSTSSSSYTALIDRTLLVSPVTVPTGGQASIDYTLKTVATFS